MNLRLAAQMDFLIACDRLKQVIRSTTLHDGSRQENSAEHSWHLALMALTLAEHAPEGTQMDRVVQLLLVHDLVEIYAGDTFFVVTDVQQQEQTLKEREAATQLFGLLPADQQQPFQDLWEEFEAQQTTEARFARALDALQPMLLTWGNAGPGCLDTYPTLTLDRLLQLKSRHLQAFPALWTYVQHLLEDAVQAGTLRREQVL